MSESIGLKRMYWHSRRGMLELDLLLVPFTEEAFDSLDHQEQLLYRDLLGEEDQDLFAWLMGRETPTEQRFIPMIELILAHSKKRS